MGKGNKESKKAATQAEVARSDSKAAAKLAKRLSAGEDLYAQYKGKPASDLQQRMADWTIEKLALTFDSKKSEAAFREGVRLGIAMRIPFQASPENQEAQRLAAIAREQERKAKVEAKPAKATEKALTKPAKAAKATAPAATVEETEPATPVEPAAKPAKTSKKAPKVTAEAPVTEATPEPAPEPAAEATPAPAKPKATRPAKAAPTGGKSKAPF